MPSSFTLYLTNIFFRSSKARIAGFFTCSDHYHLYLCRNRGLEYCKPVRVSLTLTTFRTSHVRLLLVPQLIVKQKQEKGRLLWEVYTLWACVRYSNVQNLKLYSTKLRKVVGKYSFQLVSKFLCNSVENSEVEESSLRRTIYDTSLYLSDNWRVLFDHRVQSVIIKTGDALTLRYFFVTIQSVHQNKEVLIFWQHLENSDI